MNCSLSLNKCGVTPVCPGTIQTVSTQMKLITIKSLVLLAAVSLTSCAGGPNATTGTLVGAGAGALAGGLIGNNNGNTAAGIAIGAVAGGALGNAVGNNVDQRNQRRVMYDRYGRPYYP